VLVLYGYIGTQVENLIMIFSIQLFNDGDIAFIFKNSVQIPIDINISDVFTKEPARIIQKKETV